MTVISLIIDLIVFTHGIYNDDMHNIEKINALVTSTPFCILYLIDNCLIYLFAILYIASAIDTKKEMLIKISFSIFAILTTLLITVQLVNIIGGMFGIF